MIETKYASLKHQLLLELLLVATVLGATGLMWFYKFDNQVILDLYYLPVVLIAFYRGVYRARMMALLCILSASTLFLPSLEAGTQLVNLMSFAMWATTLVLLSILIGSLCDDRQAAMDELREAHRKDALTDALTGLANRRAFEFEISRRQSDWNRDQTPFCLIMLDIDNFKNINDRHGHQAGDAVLEAFAKVLKHSIGEQDLVARHGGEEFSIILAGKHMEEAKKMAERTRKLIESSRFSYRGLTLRLSTSLGVAQILPEEELFSLMQRADAAMYCSKEAGKNCVHFHDGQICTHYGQSTTTRSQEATKDSTLAAKQNDTYTDRTTGAPTQKVFLEELRRRMSECCRYDGKISIAMVTIDSLHSGLDLDIRSRKNLLTTIAKLFSSRMRESDLVARYSANSLGILFPNTALESASKPLLRLLDDTAKYQSQQHLSLSYSVSIGVAQMIPDEPLESILERVEGALNVAVVTGGNTVCVHEGATYHIVDSINSSRDFSPLSIS